MKPVESHIENRWVVWDQHPIFQRFGGTGPLEDAVAFFPEISFFVMAFQDVLRLNEQLVASSSGLKLIARHHRAEDAGHDIWFLHDTSKFGAQLTLGELFSEDHRVARDCGYKLVAGALTAKHDTSRIALVLALEATGRSMFSRMPGYLRRSGCRENLLYFAESHYQVECDHEIHSIGDILASIELTPEQELEAIKMVDIVFDAMTAMFDDVHQRLFANRTSHRVRNFRVVDLSNSSSV